jgi:prepilin-type N-terminal cleavage/methylation domain-containing protein
MKSARYKKGITLVELVIALAIFGFLAVAVGAFARDVFYFNDILQIGLNNVTEARKVLRPFANEVRRAQPSNLGAFALAQTATSSFAFYTDIDADGVQERVRYFVEGNEFKKGIIKPTGNPLVYNAASENIVKVIRDVVPSDHIFSYYDSSYAGATTTPALAHPVTPAAVRLVRVDLTVDANPNRAPSLMTITTQVTVRNLKDNYDDQNE